jgi:hypothetical protein
VTVGPNRHVSEECESVVNGFSYFNSGTVAGVCGPEALPLLPSNKLFHDTRSNKQNTVTVALLLTCYLSS